MTFKSILSSIGTDILKGLGFAAKELPVVSKALTAAAAVIPLTAPAAAIVTTIADLVGSAEKLITTAKSGAQKQQSVAAVALEEIPTLEAIIAEFGAGAQLDPAKTARVIDAVTEVYNATADLIQTGVTPSL